MPLGVDVSWVSSSRKSGARPDERGQPKDFGAWQTINIVLLIHLDPFPPLESLSSVSHVVFRESNQSERKFYARISQPFVVISISQVVQICTIIYYIIFSRNFLRFVFL